MATLPPSPASRIAILSWALYDLANTMFSLNIVSLYFGLWVVNVMGGNDATYGNFNALSMLLVLVTAPILGALSDQAQRRIPFLVVTTSCCAILTFFLGTGSLFSSLLVFVAANYLFQSGLIFYDALLPMVSTEENRGKIGGLGIGLGYVGSLIGVTTGLLLLDQIGYGGIFRLTSLLFLAFALPCFFLVREPGIGRMRITPNMLISALAQLKTTLLHAREFPGLPRFLLGRVFYADAVNTMIIFMGIYVTNEIGFTEFEAQLVLMVAILSSIVGAFAWGFIVDRIGPKKSLTVVLFLWMFCLVSTYSIAVFDISSNAFWVIANIAGIALGGTWAADRPYILRLTPPQYIGEVYGLYSMVGRFGSITGPMLWGFIAHTLGLGRPLAVLSLLVFIAIAYMILRGVHDTPRQWERGS